MACCQPPPESQIVWFFLAAGAIMLWIFDPPLGAAGTVLLIAIFFWGPAILGCIDRTFTRCETALRLSRRMRKPGLLYCPECGLRLAYRPDGQPVAHYVCPSCSGVWCGTEEITGYLSRRYAQWKSDPRGRTPPPCPAPSAPAP
jgi:hypothetical protein